MQQPLSHPQVIGLWPSASAFSEATGINLVAARKIRQRGRIPADHWLTVASAAKKADHPEVTVESLARTYPKRGQ